MCYGVLVGHQRDSMWESVLSFPTWVLKIELRSSGLHGVFTHRVISMAPKVYLCLKT